MDEDGGWGNGPWERITIGMDLLHYVPDPCLPCRSLTSNSYVYLPKGIFRQLANKRQLYACAFVDTCRILD